MNSSGEHSITRTRNSWASVKRMVAKQVRPNSRWESIHALKRKAEKALSPYEKPYQDLKRRWDRRLRPLIGNLGGLAWSDFRPLRTTREEDWSDWLAWLLETSTTGVLAKSLFGASMACGSEALKRPTVEREVLNAQRRADIVVTWNSGQRTHVEVKVGDEAFEKTFDTRKSLRAKQPACVWRDVILIPDASRATWEEVAEGHAGEEPIHIVLWSDVVRGLRACLWKRCEPVAWQAWAWAFSSAIEVDLLGLQSPYEMGSGINRLEMASRWLEVLTRNAE